MIPSKQNRSYLAYYIFGPTPFKKSLLGKPQALVYDILPWRKVPENGARSVPIGYIVPGEKELVLRY